MRRQDLITALLRAPDHTVTVDGLAVTGLTVTASEVQLHTAKRAGPPADETALDDLRTANAQDLDRVRQEGARAAEEQLAALRESHERDKAEAVATAVADAIAAERAKPKVEDPAPGGDAKAPGEGGNA